MKKTKTGKRKRKRRMKRKMEDWKKQNKNKRRARPTFSNISTFTRPWLQTQTTHTAIPPCTANTRVSLPISLTFLKSYFRQHVFKRAGAASDPTVCHLQPQNKS